MSESDHRGGLLKRVVAWFDEPEQVHHYTMEAPSGPTEAEEWLLQGIPQGSTVLDLGCGAGRITLALSARGHGVIGADVSTALVEAARALAGQQGARAQFVRLDDPLQLPFEDDLFEVAILFKVYGYLPGRATRLAFLREVRRVLRPGGHVLLTQHVVPRENLAEARDQHYAEVAPALSGLEEGDTFPAGRGYIHWFTEEALVDELHDSSLAVESLRSDAEHGGDGLLQLVVLRNSPPVGG